MKLMTFEKFAKLLKGATTDVLVQSPVAENPIVHKSILVPLGADVHKAYRLYELVCSHADLGQLVPFNEANMTHFRALEQANQFITEAIAEYHRLYDEGFAALTELLSNGEDYVVFWDKFREWQEALQKAYEKREFCQWFYDELHSLAT